MVEAMSEQSTRDPLAGVLDDERRIMERLLRMRPEAQKDAPRPSSAQAEAQRRRREKERGHPSEASREV